MKKFILITIVTLATAGFSVQAQNVTQDSIKILKKEKKDIEISKRLNENKLELAKLQNTLQEKTDKVASTTKDAQNAATYNQATADKLKDDSQDKKLASRATKDARKAEKAAKAGRHATEELSDLQENILRLQKKISEDELKLGIVSPIAIQ